MKRPAEDQSILHVRRLKHLGPTIVGDYLQLTSGVYDFSICVDDANGGKWVKADKDMTPSEDILVESPLVCWLIGCSADWSRVSYCEHCFRLISNDENIVKESSNDEISITKISNGCNLDVQLKNETLDVPSDGLFCSPECHSAAVYGGSQDVKEGWFSIIGGAAGLRAIRQADWERGTRGSKIVMRASAPITLEGLARYYACLTRRFANLKRQVLRTCSSLNADIESQIFAEAIKPFENFVAPAFATEFDANNGSILLKAVIGEKMNQILSPRLTDLLLSPDAVAQTFGQFVVNAQKLMIWGVDNDNNYTLLQGGGVFILQSCFNHSCDPNCSVSCTDDSTLTVTTIKEIKSGEQLTIAYMDTSTPLAQRREMLACSYLFWCTCDRCERESNAAAITS